MPIENVESFYPLSPLQQGLLFHSLADPDAGAYVNQVAMTLRGDVDVRTFENAWRRVVDHHEILRTFFVWEGLSAPVQVVDKSAAFPVAVEDWSELPAKEQRQRFEALRRADLARGFDLNSPPLMRAHLVRTSPTSWELLWSFHHILLDGWSMYRVLEQMFRSYDVFAGGGESALEPARPYRDHILWLQRQSPERAEMYWREKLAGFESPTPLWSDRRHAREASDGEAYSSQPIRLSRSFTDSLRTLAQREHLTLNTLLQGAWAILLSRYSAEPDVVFGTVAAGRPSEIDGVESMVGLFINTLPTRVAIPAQAPLLDWLRELQRDQVEQREYDYSRLVDVQRWSDLPGGAPLFESLFLFENYRKDAAIEEMCRSFAIEDLRWFEQHTYPLAALAIPESEMLLRLIYETRRFERATVERMLRHWRALLEDMVANPDRRLGGLCLLDDDERESVLVDWNDTEAETSGDRTVYDLFREQVARVPNAIAVVDGDRRLSYRELAARATSLAGRLRASGVGPEDCVAVCLPRSLELVVACVAVAESGAAYTPLDLGSPRERLASMLQDSRCRVLLSRTDVLQRLPEQRPPTIALDEEPDGDVADDSVTAPPLFGGSNLAYVIFTSGSSGRPKGVEICHSALLNLVRWCHREYAVNEHDRGSLAASPAFDASVLEIWPLLTAGAGLHVAPDPAQTSTRALVAWLLEQSITLSFLVTPLAEAALAEDWPTDAALRVLLTGGDQLGNPPPPGLPFRLVNHYGPTENAVLATSASLDADSPLPPPIGRPLDNVRCYVLDDALDPVPVGVPGELFLAGRSLARGYRARPRLTAERFVPDPFATQPGSRLYRTGDQCRRRADGTLEFLGRLDRQVKVRGYRIETGEVESALCDHPEVRASAVVARTLPAGDYGLVAYIVGMGDSAPAPDELRGFLRSKLPDPMVPTTFVGLRSLPLTSNGKVDRRALPQPSGERPDLAAEFTAPAAELERRIAAIWSEALGVTRVGLYDNFFDLGGHSLLMIQVRDRVEKLVERPVRIVDLFRFPTVAALAAHFEVDGVTDTTTGASRASEHRAGRARLERLRRRRATDA